MGQVIFEDPIHHISGKISKKYRTTYNYRKNGDLKYTSVHGERSTAVGTNELAHRSKFRVVRLAAQERSHDPNKMMQDQLKFIEERHSQGTSFKYKTYPGWLFGKAWQYYDASSKTVIWPEQL